RPGFGDAYPILHLRRRRPVLDHPITCSGTDDDASLSHRWACSSPADQPTVGALRNDDLTAGSVAAGGGGGVRRGADAFRLVRMAGTDHRRLQDLGLDHRLQSVVSFERD